MVELRVHIRQNNRVLPLYTTCIEETLLLSACKSLVKEIPKKYEYTKLIIEVSSYVDGNISIKAYQKENGISYVGTGLEEVWSDCDVSVEKMTLTSPNMVFRQIGRILDGLELIKVVADELNIYVNEKGKIDFVSVVLETSDGKDKA